MAPIKRWTNRRRAWLVALLPAAVIALVLSSWHARNRMAGIEEQALDHARTLARQFASLTGPDVLSGDRERLQSIAQAVQRHYPSVVSVWVTDRDGKLLARVIPGQSERRAGRSQQSTAVRVARPIHSPLSAARTFAAGSGSTAGAPIGQFALTVDLTGVRMRQSAVLLESAGLAGLMLLLAVLLAAPFNASRGSARIPRPMPRLRKGPFGPPRQAATARDDRALVTALTRLQHDNSRLDEARREAEAASERKSRYLADISHEIRTPMNAILGFTELMAKDEQARRRADYVATVRQSVRGLLSLLNGVLDLSKAEAGHLQLEQRDLDINSLMSEMFSLFAPQAFAKGVELVVTPPADELAGVRGDAMRIKQILVNLVSNAIRFTATGHIRVSATAQPRDEGRVRVRFMVEDTGCGIPESAQSHLFDAFTQGHDNGEAPALDAGTGLGLSIASELAALMDGRVEFRSEPGAGSAFWFTVDLDPAPWAGAAYTPPEPRRQVALIDDEPITTETHASLLARAGIDAEVMTWAQCPDADAAGVYDAIVVHIPAQASARAEIPSPKPSLVPTRIPLVAWVYEHGSRLREPLWDAGYHRVLDKTADPETLRTGFEAALAAEPARPASDRPGYYAARRVLIVDDEPVNLELTSRFVTGGGFEPCTAAGSDEALRRAAAERFDAILLDLHLPECNGAATARMLRSGDGPNARTPIIVVTGDTHAESHEHILGAGVDDLLTKPVSEEVLLERLNAHVPDATFGVNMSPAVDERESLRRARGKPELACELFGALCRTLPQSRQRLSRAGEADDLDTIRTEAHRLRGAVAYCGVPRLEAAIAALEQALRGTDGAAQRRSLAEVDAAIAEVLAHAGEDFHHASAPSGHATQSRADGRSSRRRRPHRRGSMPRG